MTFIYSLFKKTLKFIYPIMPTTGMRVLLLRMCRYNIGSKTYIPSTLRISDRGASRRNVLIGNRVSIGPNVTIITDSSPNNSKLIKLFPLVSKPVTIDEDVWLGANVTILPGVTIGKCSVIGSGTVVTKSIPEYSIAYGVPAKVVNTIDKNEL